MRLTETEVKKWRSWRGRGKRWREREREKQRERGVDDGGMRAAKEESEGVMEREGRRVKEEERALRLEGNITEPERFTTEEEEEEDGTTHI